MNFGDLKKPFVGISTFTTSEQIGVAKHHFTPPSGRRLHVGAITNREAFHGLIGRGDLSSILLPQCKLQQLFTPDVDFFNVVHWKDDESLPTTTSEDLITVCRGCGPHLSGLQLDMVWPDSEMIREVKNSIPELSVIVRVCQVAIKRAEALGFSLEYMLGLYKGLANYILLDYDMKKDTANAPNGALTLIEKVLSIFPETSIVIGGGICDHNVYALYPVLMKHPSVSWEAYRSLHAREKVSHPLDMNRLKAYLNKSRHLASMFHYE